MLTLVTLHLQQLHFFIIMCRKRRST